MAAPFLPKPKAPTSLFSLPAELVPKLPRLTGPKAPTSSQQPKLPTSAVVVQRNGRTLYRLPSGGLTAFPPTSSEYQAALLQQASEGKLPTPATKTPLYQGLQAQGLAPTDAVLAGKTLAGKTLTGLANTIVYAPAGAVQAGKAAALDIEAARQGDYSFRHTRTVGGQVVAGVKQDVEHPLRNPANTLLDLAGIASLGAAGVARLAAASDAVRAASVIGSDPLVLHASNVAEAATPTSEAAQLAAIDRLDAPTATIARLKAALIRPGSQGGSLLRKNTNPAPITYRAGGLEVQQPASRAALTRGAQRVKAKVYNAAIAKPTSPANLVRLVGAKPEAKIGSELAQNERVVGDLANAPSMHLQAQTARLTTGQRRAFTVVSEGKPVEERIAFHAAQREATADAGEKAAHTAEIKRLQKAGGIVENTTDEAGNVIPAMRPGALASGRIAKVIPQKLVPHLKAANRPVTMEQAQAQLEKVAGQREGIIEKTGQMTSDELAARRNAPGKVIEGAKYEQPTPGKLGKSKALDAAAARRDALQARFDKLYEPGRGKYATVAKPRTVEEARIRLAHLEDEHHNALDEISSAMFGPIDRSEVARRNAANGKLRKQTARASGSLESRGFGSATPPKLQPTLTAERRALAEQAIEEAIAKNPNHPTTQRWAARTGEIDRLRAALNPMPGDKIEKAALGHKETIAFQGRSGKLERVGGALSVANDEVQRLERAAANRVKPTGLVGSKFDGGRAYIPGAASVPKGSRGGVGVGSRGVIARAKGFVVKSKPYKGEALQHGLVPTNPAREVIAAAQQAVNYLRRERVRTQVLKAAHDGARQHDREVLVRTDELVKGPTGRMSNSAPLTTEAKQAIGRERSTVEDEAGHAAGIRAYLGRVFPRAEDLAKMDEADGGTRFHQFAEGQAPEGYKWVDERYLNGANRTVLGLGPLGTVADAINRAERFAILYLKPAYLTTIGVSNAGMELVHEGFAAPAHLARAVRNWHKADAADSHLILAGMGEGWLNIAAAGSKPAHIRILGKVEHGLERAESRFINQPPRVASFYTEATRLGYKTPEAVHRLLNDPKLAADRIAVFRRAKDTVIDFGRLSQRERAYISRAFFFYPWVKGAARYTGHLAMEHPVGAAVTGQLSRQGQAYDQKVLGPQPSFAKGAVVVGRRNGMPLTVRAGAVNVPQTLVDTVESIGSGLHLPGFKGSPGSILTPALGLAAGLAGGTNPETGQAFPKSSGPGGVLKNVLIDQLPEAELVQRTGGVKNAAKAVGSLFGVSKTPAPNPRMAGRLYPYTPRDAAKQYVVGGAFAGRPTDTGAMAYDYAKEALQYMTPVKRAAASTQLEQDYLAAAAVKAKLIPAGTPLAQSLRHAFEVKSRVRQALARLGPGTPPAMRFEAVANAAIDEGLATKAQLADALGAIKNLSPDKVQNLTVRIERQLYSKAIEAARKYVKDHGGTIQKVPVVPG